jgi:myo-inositol-1(or 4)-monophosphatase
MADPLSIRGQTDLSQALISTGFSYASDTRRKQAQVLGALIGDVRDIRCSGAATIDFCSVARGWTDGYFLRDLKEWDLAAGALIAQEAGALVTGVAGRPMTELLVAGAPAIVELLIQRLTSAISF